MGPGSRFAWPGRRLVFFQFRKMPAPLRARPTGIRLGAATKTQIAKNNGQPVAFATKPAPDDEPVPDRGQRAVSSAYWVAVCGRFRHSADK